MMSHSYSERPSSSQLTDLAVYVVPPDLWREQLHSAQSQSIPDTISAGFIRVPPDLHISHLRQELEHQLGEEQILPREYVFLKNVGRCLTKVRGKQEPQLKVKNFVPPQSHIPEIFLLEGAPDLRSSVQSSQASSYRAESRQHDPYQLGSYRDKRGSFGSHKPVPPIQSDADPSSKSPRNIYLLRDPEKTKSASSIQSNQSFNSSKQPLPHISENNKAIQVEFDDLNGTESGQATPVPSITDSNAQETYESLPNGHDDNANDSNGEESENESTKHSAPPLSPDSGPRDEMRLPLSATPPSQDTPCGGSTNDKQLQTELEPRLPLSATPPASPPPGHNQRAAKSTTNSNEDSGIGLEDQERRRLEELQRKQLEDEQKRRQQLHELEMREKQIQDQEERWRRQRQLEEERLRHEEEERRQEALRQQEEDELRRQDELRRREEERRRDEEERRQEDERRRDEERRREEEKRRKEERRREEERRRAQEARDRYSDRRERETPSPDTSQQNHREPVEQVSSEEKQRLMEELETLRQERFEAERRREDLVKRAKQLQGKSQNKRNHARDVWKKKYFEEKKKTPPLEEQCNKLRQELDQLHRKIMSTLEGSKDKDNRRHPPDKPSMQSNLKIQATRLQHEIEDLQRRVDNIKMKLTAEMKLRNQAESELRALRAELTQKKINVTLARTNQKDSQSDMQYKGAPSALSSRT